MLVIAKFPSRSVVAACNGKRPWVEGSSELRVSVTPASGVRSAESNDAAGYTRRGHLEHDLPADAQLHRLVVGQTGRVLPQVDLITSRLQTFDLERSGMIGLSPAGVMVIGPFHDQGRTDHGAIALHGFSGKREPGLELETTRPETSTPPSNCRSRLFGPSSSSISLTVRG